MTTNHHRSRALPMFGDGYIPPEQDRKVSEDDSGFIAVMNLLLRSWPYVRPQFLGRWWIPGKGIDSQVADTVPGDGFTFHYAPFLLAVIALLFPLLGFLPATLAWPMYLLYLPVAGMVLSMYGMAYTTGKRQVYATLGVVLTGTAAIIVSTYVIDGYTDGFYVATVCSASFFGWSMQVRRTGNRYEFRIRTGTHLVYHSAISVTERLVALALGIVVADLLNQSLLQNDPIAPGLASFLGLPEFSKEAVAQLTKAQRHELKWTFVYIMLGMTFVQIALTGIRDYYGIWITQRINQDLRTALLQRWHQLSLSYHSGHRTGDSIFRIYQDSAMVTAVIGHLLGILLALVTYFISVGLVSLLSPWIGLVAGLLVVPALIWAHWAMPRMRVRTLVYRAATSAVTSTIQEAFSSIRLIKAFGASERAQRRLEEDSIIAFNSAYRVRILVALVSIVMFTVAATFMMTGEFLMAWWVHLRNPTFATELITLVGISFVVWNLASFSWTRDQFRESSHNLRKLLRDWMTAQDMAMGLRRVFDILDIEPEVKDRLDAAPMTGFSQEICYQDICFAYEPDRPVLHDVNFSIKPGTIAAIIGPTGSGKTTLMALLLRLFDPDSGSITIDGRDLRAYRVDDLRGNIAIALQENVLFGMSVRDNICYVAPDATDEQLSEAIRIAALDEFISELPSGLDTILSDRGGKLSTGQKQRLSIARAVIRNSPILILDEPTSALDAVTEHRVMANLIQWVRTPIDSTESDGPKGSKGRAVFLIAHRISTVRQADAIFYVDNGRIIESGDHDALMQLPRGRYRSFVDTELSLTTNPRPLET